MNTSSYAVLKNELKRLQDEYKRVMLEAAKFQSLAFEREALAAKIEKTISQLNDDLERG